MDYLSKTQFTKSQYQQIADLFKLGKIQKIEKIKKGFESAKVIATTSKGKYVIAKHQLAKKVQPIKKTRGSLIWEIELTNFLENLPVPHYLKSKNNRFIEDFDNFSVTVYKYLPGQHPNSLAKTNVYQLGNFLGSFHNQGKEFKKVSKDRRKFYELTPAVVKQMSRYADKQKNPTIIKVLKEVKKGIKENYPLKNLPQGPIHVDIKPENELFVGKKLSGILDFGISYNGPFMIDIGKAILWNCSKNKKIDNVLMKKFLAGYSTERHLTKTELGYLKKSMLYGIYASIFVDLYHLPFKRAPEKYCLFMINNWLPMADWLKNKNILFYPCISSHTYWTL